MPRNVTLVFSKTPFPCPQKPINSSYHSRPSRFREGRVVCAISIAKTCRKSHGLLSIIESLVTALEATCPTHTVSSQVSFIIVAMAKQTKLEEAALSQVMEILKQHHHAFWNGSGYPELLASMTIPFGARIIGIANAFQAMTSDRPYAKVFHQMPLWRNRSVAPAHNLIRVWSPHLIKSVNQSTFEDCLRDLTRNHTVSSQLLHLLFTFRHYTGTK